MGLPVDSAAQRERDDTAENCRIEITPEMVEAGIAALVAYSPYFDLEEDAVISIYRAMVIAKYQGR